MYPGLSERIGGFMPSATRPLTRPRGRAEERTVDEVVAACRDPDMLLAVVEAVGKGLEGVANSEPFHPMKAVFTDMANAVRRGSKDASHLWRDARGY